MAVKIEEEAISLANEEILKTHKFLELLEAYKNGKTYLQYKAEIDKN